jgi:hypothetical protein
MERTRRTAVALLGALAALSMTAAGSASATPAPPQVPPNLHCHTPWQLPVYEDGNWRCAGGPGPVIQGS